MLTLIKANHERGVELAGVAGPVPRPVDIDQTQTAFKALRTLRIYHFEPPAVIDGHAEEDEVFMVALTGSADLVIRSDHWSNSQNRYALDAANARDRVACAAYLPPHAEYVLTPRSGADIAYVRATPKGGRPPAILSATPRYDDAGACILLDDATHAERLRLRLLQVDANRKAVALTPIQASERMYEALVHIRTQPARNTARIETLSEPSMLLESWDTFAVAPGESPTLHIAAGSSAVCLMVAAK